MNVQGDRIRGTSCMGGDLAKVLWDRIKRREQRFSGTGLKERWSDMERF